MDGTKANLRHTGNKLTLSFFAKNGARTERWLAKREKAICERKLRFLGKSSYIVAQLAREGTQKLNNNWKGRGAR
ncbi:hypothetical protein EVB77_136 [Rhizobium phage RHph_N1_10]|nr:hypothetical protein EVB77_136 [Rhizobium phage RHph_N1_10]